MISQLFKIALLISASVHVSCSDKMISYEDLSKPVYIAEDLDGGLCSKLMAVDSKAVLWSNYGCEGDSMSLSKQGSLSAYEYESVVVIYSKLLDKPKEYGNNCFPRCNWRYYIKILADEGLDYWRSIGLDMAGEDFRNAYDFMNAL